MALFYSSVPVSHDSVIVSQPEQNQNPETGAAKWNSDIIVLFTPVLFLLSRAKMSDI